MSSGCHGKLEKPRLHSGSSYFALSENKEARSESELMIICKRYGEEIHLKEKDSRKGTLEFFLRVGDGNSRMLCKITNSITGTFT